MRVRPHALRGVRCDHTGRTGPQPRRTAPDAGAAQCRPGVTNATHVAVPLKYGREDPDSAPVVVAKGYDAVAQQIEACGGEPDRPWLRTSRSRALAKEVDVGKPIPVQWYQAVAEVLAVVYELKQAG
jgi:flagellar biosynthesis protein FlhB